MTHTFGKGVRVVIWLPTPTNCPGLTWRCPITPSCGRCDGGVPDIELGRIECCALRRDCRLALCDLRVEDRELTLGGKRLGAVLRQLRLELRMGGRQLFARLSGRGSGLEQSALPCKVATILFERRGGGRYYRVCRLDIRELQRMLSLERLGLRHRGRDAGFGLRRGGAIVIVNQLREHLPFVDMFEILDGQLAHVAGHLRGYGSEIRLKIRIVRCLPPLPRPPSGSNWSRRR